MTKWLFRLLLLALPFLPAAPVSANPLADELRQLVATHPEIKTRASQLEAAQAGIDRAFAGYLPKLDAVAQVGPQYIDSPVTRDAGGGSFTAISEIYGVRLTQPLFDGFATPSDLRAARLAREVGTFTLEGTRQNVVFAGIAAYIEVLRQSRLIGLARRNEETIRQQLHLEDERVRRGSGIAVDVLLAKSRLQIAKERRVTFEGALEDAHARYLRVFGHAPETATMNEVTARPELVPDSIEGAIKTAEADNPAIDASLATVEIANEKRRLIRADYYPRLNVVAAANREKDNDLVEGTRTDFSVLLTATWNIFSGFATNAGVAQAAADYRASQDNHERIRREVLEQTRLAWNDLQTAKARVELLENASAIADEVLTARIKLRDAGRETALNVLDAENELYNARINLTQAEGDRTLAAYRLLQGMGRLDAATLGYGTN